MGIKFETVQAGTTYYMKKRANLTSLVLPVRVLSVDAVAQTVVASCNGNAATTYHRLHVEKWFRNEPKAK